MMTKATCPICRRPTAPGYAPFCSRGCKDRDLLQWLGEGYRLPGSTIAPNGLDSGKDPD
ncbi:DNA gyrase inhibitor YacG [uncultured Sphingomonas sp.]|uniref:DNA gyrase inhibitor YacG n=1 Tax=uncultured Sphingomonas sp. TaxID=158754 RepID=UPI0026205C94|nr:DNA gyrase inhibitor YacG [uncultured Sphingomonas sp.]